MNGKAVGDISNKAGEADSEAVDMEKSMVKLLKMEKFLVKLLEMEKLLVKLLEMKKITIKFV